MRQNEYTYLVTSVTEGRRARFQRTASAQVLIDVMLLYRKQEEYELHSFVVMPDHFHALISPADEVTLEKCVQFIKGASAHQLERGRIWQRGFNQQGVRDAAGYDAYVRYIEANPGRRGLTNWPFVSSRAEFALDPMPSRFRA